jgi:hypothetical protein
MNMAIIRPEGTIVSCDECGEAVTSYVWLLYRDDWTPVPNVTFCSEWCRDQYAEDVAVQAAKTLSPAALVDAAREAQALNES